MPLYEIQAIMTGLSCAVQEASKSIAAPLSQAIRVSFLESYHLTIPDKTQQGHTGLYQWGTR